MNGYNKEASRALITTPPRAQASYCAQASGTAASLDLSKLGVQTQNLSSSLSTVVGAFKSYLTVQNDGATNTLYIITAKDGTTAIALAPATLGTSANPATAAFAIPPNSSIRFLIEPTIDLFLGYCTSASTTTIRAFVTSDQG